jgi:hypothetical protein
MKKGSTLFLRSVIVLMALGALAICIFALPVALRSDNTGLYRPIALGMYVAAIPFFIALWQTMKLLSLIDKNNAFSEFAANALKNIKLCGVAISVLFILGMPLIFNAGDKDDAPGVVALGLIIVFASAVIATFAGVLQKLVQNAVDIKKENELTV